MFCIYLNDKKVYFPPNAMLQFNKSGIDAYSTERTNMEGSDLKNELLHKAPSQNLWKTKTAGYIVALSSFLWGYSLSVLNVCIAENAQGSILVGKTYLN